MDELFRLYPFIRTFVGPKGVLPNIQAMYGTLLLRCSRTITRSFEPSDNTLVALWPYEYCTDLIVDSVIS